MLPDAGCDGVRVLHTTDSGSRWAPAGWPVGARTGAVGRSFAGGSVGRLCDGTGVWTTDNVGDT